MVTKRTILLLSLISLNASWSLAQLVSGRFVTSFYSWEKFDTVNVSNTYLRAFQTVQLSVAEGDVSLHTYLQGAVNGTNSFGDVGRVRVYNLYMKWADIFKTVDLSLGRQAIYAGVANGTIDGVSAKVHLLQNTITVLGFVGAGVEGGLGGVQKDVHDNLGLGGQVVTTMIPNARVGLSYLNRKEHRDPYWTLRVRDTISSPVPYYIANESEAEQYLSGDVYYSYGSIFSLYGRYDYDLNMSSTSRVQAGGRVNVTDPLAITVDYIHRMPRISFNSIFSAFTWNSVDEIEGGVEYEFTPLLRAFGKLAYVSYTDTKSHRWTLGVNAGYGSLSYVGGDGYAGQLQGINLEGSYPLLGAKVIPSAGVSYMSYRLSPDNPIRDKAWTILLGATVRPVRIFSFDVQGQMLTNKIVKHDMRLLVKLNYWFAERLSFFREEGKQ